MPEISVIIPVYNKEKYLEDSLRSVLEQSYRNLEIIVVNDGSTDNSLTIAKRMAENDDRVRIVDIPNGGVSHARNVGLAHASGEWIQFLDADDLLEESYLTQAMEILQDSPADILFSGFSMVDELGNPLKTVSIPESGVKDQSQLCSCFVQYQYSTGFFGFISNKLFRRTLWERSGAQFPVGTTLAEDLDFYVKLYPAITTALFWSGNSFRYLQTDTNYLHNTIIDYYSQIQIHMDIRTWFIESGQYSAYKAPLDKKITEYASYILFFDNEENKDLSGAFHFLTNRSDIMECIDPAHMSGFDKLVLYCLCRRYLPGIRALFASRNGIRSLYRMVKRHA